MEQELLARFTFDESNTIVIVKKQDVELELYEK